MISPRLSKVVSGTRLTTDLLNSMIKRTEYAADLLQQYKLIAGNQMYIEPHYDGTRVSYLQPVGGGTTPAQPVSPAYRIVGYSISGIFSGFIYDGSTFTDIFVPGSALTIPYGIDGLNIVGRADISGITRGFLYDGSTFTTFSVPGSTTTIAYGIDGLNIVGHTVISGINRGFLYNGSTFTDIFVPGSTLTIPYGIDGLNIVGRADISGITRGFLYDGSTFTTFSVPGSTTTIAFGIG